MVHIVVQIVVYVRSYVFGVEVVTNGTVEENVWIQYFPGRGYF